ncbi:TonB-dependent receptor [Rudaea cellulosilytica]|uniref:TonB-dependent receptor n=1 Tax=Rudaea cellulosilytica TaxID=540746 RepID=UPI00037C4D4F|nr:TonB-dependent receptor [Rudaea cellulosilytica]
MTITLKRVVLATAIATALLPIMAGAQNAAAPSGTAGQPAATAGESDAASKKKADQTQEMGTVVVTGIRESLQAGLDVKRNAESFVDAISAEDVGKLPDANIAEVLQRVPGVTIQRTRGEGDFVSIRGLSPNFVRGEVDGRTVVSGTVTSEPIRNGGQGESTGRATNFDVLPAEIVERVEVYKSPTAAMIEGGIGGVVNIVTRDPIDLGNHIFGSANATYRENNKATDPSFSVLGSWRNDAKDFGILGSLTYSKRSIREDGMDTYGWSLPSNWAALPDVSGGAGQPVLTGQSYPWAMMARQQLESRERTTAQVKADWKFADDSLLTANALYSKRKSDDRSFYATFGTSATYQFVDPPAAVVPPGKPGISSWGDCQQSLAAGQTHCTVPGLTASNGNITTSPVTSTTTDVFEDKQQRDSLTQLGLNYKKDLGSLHLNADLAYARGNGSLGGGFTSVNTAYVWPYTSYYDGTTFQIKPNASVPSDGASYFARGASIGLQQNNQSETAFALGGKLDLDNVPLSRELEFGVRFAERDVDKNNYGDTGGHGAFPILTGASGIHPDGNFGNGQFAFPLDQLFFMNTDQLLDALKKIDPNTPGYSMKFDPNSSYSVAEKTDAFYIQDNLETEIAGMPLKGNVGFRGVRTNESATGYFRPFTIVYDEQHLGHLQYTSTSVTSKDYKSSYFNLLPVLNLELDIRDDLLARFAAGKSVTRPDFATQLAPSLNIINFGDNDSSHNGTNNRIAAGGNPGLKAYEATNYDLGLEWYLAPSSALWAAVYYKDIGNFIAGSNADNVERFGYVWGHFTTPENQGGAKVHGLELGYQQVFENGFGFLVNGTLAGSSAKYTNGTLAGKTIEFDGVSRKSFNTAVFYEKDGFSARVAYTYRGRYVLIGQDIFGMTEYNDHYGQVDASVSYAIDPHWTVVADVVNLGNSNNRLYANQPQDALAYQIVGRRLEFGVRAKF